jgi:tetratricopeptide (TPR) repeat protein
MSRSCAYSLPAFLLTVWFLLPAPLSSAGMTMPFAPQGGFDFTGTMEKAINYAEAYLKRQAAVNSDGQQLNVRQAPKEALEYLERHLQQIPADLELQTAVAVIAWSSSRQKAQRLFEHIVRTNPSYAIAHCFLAYIVVIEDEAWNDYGKHFEDAIQADPTYVPAYNSVAMVYVQIGKIDAALRILTQGTARFPNEASLFYNQAYIHARQQHWEAAEVSLQHAVTRQPTEGNRLMLGMILLKRHEYGSAQAVFDSILDMNPQNVLALVGLADSYKERHDFAMAISLAEQALAIDPANEEIKAEVQDHNEAYEKWKSQQKEK